MPQNNEEVSGTFRNLQPMAYAGVGCERVEVERDLEALASKVVEICVG